MRQAGAAGALVDKTALGSPPAGDMKGRHIGRAVRREEVAAAALGAAGDRMRHRRAPAVAARQWGSIGRAVARTRARIAGPDTAARCHATARFHTGGMPGRPLVAGRCRPVPEGSSLEMSSHLGVARSWEPSLAK